ncbi:MAG: 1-(5-phosphoribosyl)-5-[(5-phosphoribosylamino)methylideneamino]imidazole-4-carboxamide isomerase, partial [Chitinophagaceae bacterium]
FTRWLTLFGPGKFLLGADVRDKKISIHGWKEDTSLPVLDFIGNYAAKGITQVFCTDISKDGKLEGPSTGLYREIIGEYPSIYFIASGGVASIADLEALRNVGCSAAIIGKAIYENRITLKDLKSFV